MFYLLSTTCCMLCKCPSVKKPYSAVGFVFKMNSTLIYDLFTARCFLFSTQVLCSLQLFNN